MEKTDDPDYRKLRGFLKANYAQPLFYDSLDELIRRAGIRVLPDRRPEERKPAPPASKRKTLLSKPAVEDYVRQNKTQDEIAAIHGVNVITVIRFMKRYGINPSYGNSGKWVRRKIEVQELRADPDYPVPV